MTTVTGRRMGVGALAAAVASLAMASRARADESNLILPDLNSVKFHNVGGANLLMFGLILCAAGLAFGLVIYRHLKNLPVHRSMLEVSELIYETCKTYLKNQIKFILLLWSFIAV